MECPGVGCGGAWATTRADTWTASICPQNEILKAQFVHKIFVKTSCFYEQLKAHILNIVLVSTDILFGISYKKE